LVIPTGHTGTSSSALASSINFKKHYYEYVDDVKKEIYEKSQTRITKQMEKIEKEELEQLKYAQKLAEDEKKKSIPLEEIKEKSKEDEVIEKMQKMFIGKGTSAASYRLFLEYKNLTTSKDFKNFTLSFKEENLYIWKMTFDILKFDLSQTLREDYEKITKINGAVFL